jgi:plasmid stabilization system protein ParE
MRIKYTQQAIADMAAIADFFEMEKPFVLPKIRSDIESKIALIKVYPEANPQEGDKSLRKAVTRRYRYIIHYRLLYEINELHIVAVRHFRQKRKFRDS